MKCFLALSLLIIGPSGGFSIRSDIDWAYRHRDWERIEMLITPILFPDHHTHRMPPDASRLSFRLGVALWHQGKWKTAKICFKKVYSKFSKSSPREQLQALLGMSDCAHRLGEYGNSIRLAKKFHQEARAYDWRCPSPFANGPDCLGNSPFFGEVLPDLE